MNKVYIGLGSNQGNRLYNLLNAINHINLLKGLTVVKKSHVYITKPMYRLNQRMFLNMVVELSTSISPLNLISDFKNIEIMLGREICNEENSPRKIDIDILDYNNSLLSSAELNLPHPKILERVFVLKPWCDIAPNFKLVNCKKSISELLDKLKFNNYDIELFEN